MNVTLKTYTPRPAHVCAEAAKTCYSELPPDMISLSDKEVDKILKQVIKSGHHSVLEHAVFTFNISGVSRVLTHQLVRHRLASYSQQSQRYVASTEYSFECVVPPLIEGTQAEDDDYTLHSKYMQFMDSAVELYEELIEEGIPPEDARYVLPGATYTNIVVSMNARELFHFFELRMCNRAQWEIQELANQMYLACNEVAPEIFKYAGPSCWTSKCKETKSCGSPPKKV